MLTGLERSKQKASQQRTPEFWLLFESENQAWLTRSSLEEKWITVKNTKHSQPPTTHRMHSREAAGHENSCVWTYLHCLGSFPRGEIWAESMIKTHPLRILIILSKSLLNSSCSDMCLPTDMPMKIESVLSFFLHPRVGDFHCIITSH